MKKKVVLMIVAVVMVCALFAACGSPKPAATEAPSAEATVEASAEPSEEVSEKPSADSTEAATDGGAMQAFVDTIPSSVMDSMNEALGGMVTVEIKADGNDLLYVLTYGKDLPIEEAFDDATLEQMKTSLQPQMDSLKEQFQQLDGLENSKLIAQFYNDGGTDLGKIEF